jgi:hypothetical protein
MHDTLNSDIAADRGLMPFSRLSKSMKSRPAASVLSKSELRRIVAEILG